MTDILTTRQVQDILKVDRITIYRMLQDGRLKGIKVGSQWLFTTQEVERLLSGERPQEAFPVDSGTVFPVHCVQTIQDLLSGVRQMRAIVLDVSGVPVTERSAQVGLSRMVTGTAAGLNDLHQAWQAFAASPGTAFVGPAGLTAVTAPIHGNGGLVGWVLVGQVFTTPTDLLWTSTLSAPPGIQGGLLEGAAAAGAGGGRGEWQQRGG